MPIRAIVTEGTTADCVQAGALIENLPAQGIIADRGYDSDAIVEVAEKKDMKVVIPPRKNRKVQREYDKIAYKKRHLVENAFLHIKQWRGVATRYAKRTESFLAAIHIRCLFIWVTRDYTPYSFFQVRSSGDLINRLTSSSWLRNMVTNQFIATIIDGFFVISYLIALLILSPTLGFITVLIGSMQLAIVFGASKKTKFLVQESVSAEANLHAYQIELLKGIATVKASGGDHKAFQNWQDLLYPN